VFQEDGSFRPDAYTIDKNTGCWRWNFSFNGTSPQGAQRLPDGSYIGVNARRRMWEISFPDIPVPPQVSVNCGNKRCVNPSHLISGTFKQQRHLMIVKLSLDGMHPNDIAKKMVIPRSAVFYALKKYNVEPVGGWNRPPRSAPSRTVALSLPKDTPRPATVSEKHWDIFLAARFKSHVALSEEVGLTRERIRQIVDRVMREVLVERFQKGKKAS
jgi:hypothetical protein